MTENVFTAFTLPNGSIVKNRLVKAAMEENLATEDHLPGKQLLTLYEAWAKGGVGLIITGNVMIDRYAMTGPGGVVLEKDTQLDAFEILASKAKQNNTKIWMQINHPGRQVFKRMGGKVLSPSDIALKLGKHSSMFSRPTPMSEAHILDVIARFTATAVNAEKAGFDGVEVHAAHGYLLAQFLSPLTNVRDDKWGGSLFNRARLLLEVVRSIRAAVKPSFTVAVKLNSADFQRGGFDVDDALQVVKWLEPFGVDVVELSGGSYEAPAMQGRTGDKRTLAREAYFLEFAEKIAKQSQIPIMTTGGIKRLAIADKVLASGIELVGIASALAYSPDLPNQWLVSPEHQGLIPTVSWKDKALSGLANMALVKRQLSRLGSGKNAKFNASPLWSLILDQVRTARRTKRYRKFIACD